MISDSALAKLLKEPDLGALGDILLKIPETKSEPHVYKLCKAAGQFGGFDVIDLVLTHAKTRQSGTGTFMELVLFNALCRENRVDMVKRIAPFFDPDLISHGIFEACEAGHIALIDTLLPRVPPKDRAATLRRALTFDAITPDIFEILYRECEKDDIRLMVTCFDKTPKFFQGKKIGEVSERVLAMFRARVKVDLDRDELAKFLDSVSLVAGVTKPKVVL